MKFSKKFIYLFVVCFLLVLLIIGHGLNKKSSSSKKNEISNLKFQIKSKNKQLAEIQKKFLENGNNINSLVNPTNISFTKIFL